MQTWCTRHTRLRLRLRLALCWVAVPVPVPVPTSWTLLPHCSSAHRPLADTADGVPTHAPSSAHVTLLLKVISGTGHRLLHQ